jgi:hypothetical protein
LWGCLRQIGICRLNKKIYNLMRKFGFLGIVGNRLADVNGR